MIYFLERVLLPGFIDRVTAHECCGATTAQLNKTLSLVCTANMITDGDIAIIESGSRFGVANFIRRQVVHVHESPLSILSNSAGHSIPVSFAIFLIASGARWESRSWRFWNLSRMSSEISVEGIGLGDVSTLSSSISVNVAPQSFLLTGSAEESTIPVIQCRSPSGGSQAFTLANGPLCKRLDFMADGANDSIPAAFILTLFTRMHFNSPRRAYCVVLRQTLDVARRARFRAFIAHAHTFFRARVRRRASIIFCFSFY